MQEKITIIKTGGAIIEDPAQLEKLLSNFAKLEGRKILVHGGGRRATDIAQQLGISTHLINGRRVTDQPMLEVAVMVYGGLINKTIVARLQALGVPSLGLTGADMNLIRSHQRPVVNGVNFGYVGDVEQTDAQILKKLIDWGITPVISPLTHDGKGQLLNTNADTMASEIAKALVPYYEVTLVYCFEKKGVLALPNNTESIIPCINRHDFKVHIANGTISAGMIPKIESALSAAEAGVHRVIITDAESSFQSPDCIQTGTIII